MKILLVEDDPMQVEWLMLEFQQRLPSAQIECISTESEFRDKFQEVRQSPPSVILLDVMLRWTNASDHMVPIPPNIGQEKYFLAGLRCQRLLADCRETRDIPVIFLSVLDESDLADESPALPLNVSVVAKASDPDLLFAKLLDLMKPR